ncbi:MAG: hypothetical protein V4498_05665 [candidate division FCPU426 bacterium]
MNQGKQDRPWTVEIEPEAIRRAHALIQAHYAGAGRKDMEAWLARFVGAVHDNPLHVLGYPPLAAVSDPDLLYFPGDRHRKVSGLAHASKIRRVIHVYEIMITLPKE